MGWVYGRRWVGWFSILTASFFIRANYLQYTNFLRLSDKESVTVSPVIPVYGSRKKTEIKTVSVITILSCSLFPLCKLNWINGWGRENTFDVDCTDRCTQKSGGQKLARYGSRECKNYFMKRIELFLTMLSNFGRKTALENSACW